MSHPLEQKVDAIMKAVDEHSQGVSAHDYVAILARVRAEVEIRAIAAREDIRKAERRTCICPNKGEPSRKTGATVYAKGCPTHRHKFPV